MSGKMIGVSMLVFIVAVTFAMNVQSQIAKFTASDPGVRPGSNGAGGMLPGLTSVEQQAFAIGRVAFQEVGSVQGTLPDTEKGLGPRFNLDSCAGCHGRGFLSAKRVRVVVSKLYPYSMSICQTDSSGYPWRYPLDPAHLSSPDHRPVWLCSHP